MTEIRKLIRICSYIQFVGKVRKFHVTLLYHCRVTLEFVLFSVEGIQMDKSKAKIITCIMTQVHSVLLHAHCAS